MKKNHEKQWKKWLSLSVPKLLQSMSLILILTCSVGVLNSKAGNNYSQTTRLSINLNDASIKDVLLYIERHSEFSFMYDNNEVDVNRKVSIKAKEETLDSILEQLFMNEHISTKTVGKHIILIPERSKSETKADQQQAVSGKVSDSSGQALPGVTVVIKGTTQGTVTDMDGVYRITNVPTGATLQFTFVGLKPYEIAVANQPIINVTMEEETIGLEEVVAIGYGTAKKSDLTGSVNNLSDDKLVDVPSFNIGTALQGKVAGVEVIRQGGGAPGLAPLVRIRGTNSVNTSGDPLYVVDGIVGVENALTTLNPNDIASMDILKDASATAIYGARGANGVIMITTKQGKSGEMQVDFDHSTSVGLMMRHFYALNAAQLMYVYEQAMANAPKYGSIVSSKDFRGGLGNSTSYSEMTWLFEQCDANSYPVDLIGNDGNYYKPRFDTNWEDYTFRNAISNSTNVSVRGGSEKAIFALSLRASDEQGLMKQSYYKRYSAKIDTDLKPWSWLDLKAKLMVAKTQKSNQDDNTILRNSAEAWSILPPYTYPDDEDTYGTYAGQYGTNSDFNVGEQWYSPTYLFSQYHGIDDNIQATGSLAFTFRINKYLTFDTNFAFDTDSPKSSYYEGKLDGDDGEAGISQEFNFYWQNEDYLNYSRKIDDHLINAMIGMTWSRERWESFEADTEGYFDNFYEWHNLGAASERPDVESEDGESSLNSYFSRLNYVYKDKYLATITGRFDGSSKFGKNNKYGFFPSVGLAWRVYQEDFMKNVKGISNLKLRASWGKTGNQEIGSYVTQQYISTSTILIGEDTYTGLYPSSIGNDDLKWETTRQIDVGVELGLLKGAINLELDYYNKKTTDMLLDVELPESTTSGSATMNYGSVSNRGVDFSINTNNIRNNFYSWSTGLVVNINKNEILQLGPTHADIYQNTGAGNGTTVLREGEPIGSFFGLIRLGTYGTDEVEEAAKYGMLPGDLKYQDTNEDGEISLLDDGVIIGRGFPKMTANLTNTFTYKNFDASINIRFVTGVDKANVNESAEDRQLVSGGKNSILDAWRPDHQNTMIAQIRPGNGGCYYQSYADSHMIENAAYIRGQSASLGYTFPETMSFISKTGFKKFRVYFTAENFFLITSVWGYDPEGSSPDKMNSLKPNVDKYMYPRPTTLSLGVNLSF